MFVCLVHFLNSRVSLCLQLKALNHDNIKSFVGACVEPGRICYVMQCCSRGTVQVSQRITLRTLITPVLPKFVLHNQHIKQYT